MEILFTGRARRGGDALHWRAACAFIRQAKCTDVAMYGPRVVGYADGATVAVDYGSPHLARLMVQELSGRPVDDLPGVIRSRAVVAA